MKKMKLGIGLIVLLFGVVFVSSYIVTDIRHEANSVNMLAEGNVMSLQQAVDSGLFKELPKSVSLTSSPIHGHSAENIWVSVDGVERTLQQSLTMSFGLCGTSSVSFSQNLISGHSADELIINVGGVNMSLQEAIDSGEFCPFAGDLVNNQHTGIQCMDAGGIPVSDGDNYFCRMDAVYTENFWFETTWITFECASGWTKYSDWSATVNTTGVQYDATSCKGGTCTDCGTWCLVDQLGTAHECTTSSHQWSNQLIESCKITFAMCDGMTEVAHCPAHGNQPGYQYWSSITWQLLKTVVGPGSYTQKANVTELGCY